MLLRVGVALALIVLLAGGARADQQACVASLTAARDFAARLDSALEKLRVRAEGKRTVVAGAECGRVEVEVRADARGRADKPWRPEKGVRRVLLLDGAQTLCGERHVEERARRLRGVARHPRRAGRHRRALQARRRRVRQRGRKTEIRTSP